jgi:hypothetical protein
MSRRNSIPQSSPTALLLARRRRIKQGNKMRFARQAFITALRRLLRPVAPRVAGVIALLGVMLPAADPIRAAAQVDIQGPIGSGQFGSAIVALPSGNLAIADPQYQGGMGAVHLYNGATGERISTLTGSTPGDIVGRGGLVVLPSGNLVVRSFRWDNGVAVDAGAVTWVDGTQGLSGTISAANSLVGSNAGDQVGSGHFEILPNGNFVVGSPQWDNGDIVDASAVTWINGTRGLTGTVSPANSLVGSTSGDHLGNNVIDALANSNYLVSSSYWDNGSLKDAGAVTWGDGTRGVTGTISALNSLVGSTVDDQVGGLRPTRLANGNYVVGTIVWDKGNLVNVGAVTWGDGMRGVTGTISAANSLIGSSSGDNVGHQITPLPNGNFVVSSPFWRFGTAYQAGAVTWGDGTRGITGAVSAVNSLIGTFLYDAVGSRFVQPLTNGNYVVISPYWRDGVRGQVGAVTWADGTRGITGTISAANSLIGSTAQDRVGIGLVVALNNGNYVVSSPEWANGLNAQAGAVTWGDGTRGVHGPVTAANSLVGSASGDQISSSRVEALSNGNYVVHSPAWSNGTTTQLGAATWGDGTRGITGTISAANSLVGSTAGDRVGAWGVVALSNGNYVVRSLDWTNAVGVKVGAATWGDGTRGITGTISAANSLVGSSAQDRVGWYVMPLVSGNYVAGSPLWDAGPLADAGAATWGDGERGVTGTISAANSLIGSSAEDRVGITVERLSDGNYVVWSNGWSNGTARVGAVTWGDGARGLMGTISANTSVIGGVPSTPLGLVVVEDAVNNQVVVGRPAENLVTLYRPGDVTLKIVVQGDGTVTRSSSLATYPAGMNVTLTAVPEPGTRFIGWSGAMTSTINPLTLVLTTNQQITATFARGIFVPLIRSEAGAGQQP